MGRKIVSEKTLELNISAEILQVVRSRPAWASAFWLGMKQFQEAQTGLDEMMRGLPPGRHLALQFKAPWPSKPDTQPYRYSINETQNNRLLDLAARWPNGVYYVFPNYNTFTRVQRDSPTLSLGTILFPANLTNGIVSNSSGR